MNNETVFQTWLNSPQSTPEEKQELTKYSEQEKQKLFTSKPLFFGTAGIRVLVGLGTQKLNRFTCRWLAKGFANYLRKANKNPSVLVVHDGRENGYDLYLEIVFSLAKEGIDVYVIGSDHGAISTPILSYLIREKKLDGGINLTASHNPMEYNGLKIYDSFGKQLNSEAEKNLIKCLIPIEEAINLESAENINKNQLKWIKIAEIDEYFKKTADAMPKTNCKEMMSVKSSFSVIFDHHNGTTKGRMQNFIKQLGFTNFKEFNSNATVINPEEKSSFVAATQLAEEEKAEYICAADLDGDRAAIAEKQKDGSWYFFNGNEIGIILAFFKLEFSKNLKKPYIVSTYVTNTLINKLFPKIPIHVTATGFKNISEIIDQEEKKGNDLLIAFEESIGVLVDPLHREKDSYQQIAYLLETVAFVKQNKLNLKRFLNLLIEHVGCWAGFTDFYKVNSWDHTLVTDQEKVTEKISELSNYSLERIDIDKEHGIISWFMDKDSWIKFRYSGTEPKLKVYFNLFEKKKKNLDKFVQNFKKYMDSLFQI